MKTLAKQITLAVLSLCAASVQAAQSEPVAIVTHLAGVMTVQRADGSTRLLSQRSPIMEGDTLSTQDGAYARLKFSDNSEMVIRPNSVMQIAEFRFADGDVAGDKARFELQKGGFRAVTGALAKRSRQAISYNTPVSSIKPQGTHLGALFCSNDCGGVPTPTGKTPDNGLHVDVASGAVVVTPKLTVALPSSGSPPGATPSTSGQGGSGSGSTQTPGGSTGTGGNTGTQAPGGTTPNPVAGPVGGVSPTLPGGTGGPTPVPTPAPGAGAPAPAVVLNAGQFGYLPPPQNGVQPPLVLVPPSQAIQVRMPVSISQNSPQGSATSKTSDPECVVQ